VGVELAAEGGEQERRKGAVGLLEVGLGAFEAQEEIFEEVALEGEFGGVRSRGHTWRFLWLERRKARLDRQPRGERTASKRS
jgi:hypothetical protein